MIYQQTKMTLTELLEREAFLLEVLASNVFCASPVSLQPAYIMNRMSFVRNELKESQRQK